KRVALGLRTQSHAILIGWPRLVAVVLKTQIIGVTTSRPVRRVNALENPLSRPFSVTRDSALRQRPRLPPGRAAESPKRRSVVARLAVCRWPQWRTPPKLGLLATASAKSISSVVPRTSRSPATSIAQTISDGGRDGRVRRCIAIHAFDGCMKRRHAYPT